MIISVWKPHSKYINKKKVFTHYELVNNDTIHNIGTSGYKVIWMCDNKNCKYPNKIHSIQRHHLNKKRSSLCCEDVQICHACQFTGKGNPRYGDNRTWDDIMGTNKSNEIKKKYRENFRKNNPSKLEHIKIKKKQIVINFDNVSKFIDRYGYVLNKIDGDNKQAILNLTCDRNHHFDIKYHSFKRGHRCKLCYYDSIRINPMEIDIFEKYSKSVRYKVRTTFRKYKNQIDPNDLKLNTKEYHIDHIYSIIDGFKNNIDPSIISSFINLRVISKEENLKKGSNSDITLEDLLDRYHSI
jgi:hypothetical protein